MAGGNQCVPGGPLVGEKAQAISTHMAAASETKALCHVAQRTVTNMCCFHPDSVAHSVPG